MLRYFEKKVFGGCKRQIFFIGDPNAGRGDKMVGGLVTSQRQGDSFAGPGGYSANLEVRRSFLRGSWRLCTPSLPGERGGGRYIPEKCNQIFCLLFALYILHI